MVHLSYDHIEKTLAHKNPFQYALKFHSIKDAVMGTIVTETYGKLKRLPQVYSKHLTLSFLLGGGISILFILNRKDIPLVWDDSVDVYSYGRLRFDATGVIDWIKFAFTHFTPSGYRPLSYLINTIGIFNVRTELIINFIRSPHPQN